MHTHIQYTYTETHTQMDTSMMCMHDIVILFTIGIMNNYFVKSDSINYVFCQQNLSWLIVYCCVSIQMEEVNRQRETEKDKESGSGEDER